MKELLKGLNEASKLIHEDAKAKGFYDAPIETGTLLMLVVSELSEALEADRKGSSARKDLFIDVTTRVWANKNKTQLDKDIECFCDCIKDTHEDEIADTIIRLLDYAAYKHIDLEWHIDQKLKYNKTRHHKHGKSY